MGMDMYWVKTPESIQEATKKARAEFYAACSARGEIPKEEGGRHTREELESGDWLAPPANASERYKVAQLAVKDASERQSLAEKNYFRLNWWGMSRYAQVMAQLGMTYESESTDEWPKYRDDLPGFDEAVEAVEDGKPCGTHPEQQIVYGLARFYVHERDRKCQAHPAGGKTIPDHKFSSNDGWWVTPEEIRAALKAYEKNEMFVEMALESAGLTSENQRAYWERWIEFLRGAAEQDGFKVH